MVHRQTARARVRASIAATSVALVLGLAGSAAAQNADAEVLFKNRYDVVFSDLGMPEVNGWDLALATKSRHPDTAVVLFSGWGFQLEEETVVQRGVDIVLAKPFSWEDVDQALRAITELRARVA